MSIMQEHAHRFNTIDYNQYMYQMKMKWKRMAHETIRRNKLLNKNSMVKTKIQRFFSKLVNT